MKRKSVFLLAILLAGHTVIAAPAPAGDVLPKRPRIGLVLSGGGARGAAHVGVIKVLEEMRIPVAFITGTSMGSAVGGLYASGLNAKELETLFAKFDWEAAFTDSPPRRELSFRRKNDDRTFLVKARIGIGKDGVKLPLGLVDGQNFVTELRKLSHVTESVKSFDGLSIPYRALAVDLETGQPAVLDKGDLVNAVRASIAIAPLFGPVEINGRQYVDGGYMNNIPVDVIQAAGVDRIICVNIGTPLSKRADIKSVLDVISQTGRFGGEFQDKAQLARLGKNDYLIQPDLNGLSFVDFGKIPEIMKRGESAARAMAKELSQFSVSAEEYKAWRDSLAKTPALPRIDGIEIINGTRIADSVLKPFISQPVGTVLDPVRMQADLARLYGLGYFDCIDYHVENRSGKKILIVNAPRKSWGPNYLKLGFKMAEDFKGHGDYGIMARYQMTELNPLGAEFQVDGIVGLNSGACAEFYQPVGKVPRHLSYGSPYFLFLKASLQQNNEPVLLHQVNELPFRDNHSGFGGGGGRSIGNWGELRLGMNSLNQTYRTPTAPDYVREYKQIEGAVRLAVDTLDNAGFPREGFLGQAEMRATGTGLGAPAPATMGGIMAMWAFSGERATVRLKGEWANNFDDPDENAYLQRVGGFLNLGGYSQNSLIGTEKALGQAQYLYQVGHLMGMPLYGGLAAEWGGVWDHTAGIDKDAGIFSGSLFAALDTGIGPAYLAVSNAEGGRSSVYLYVGQVF